LPLRESKIGSKILRASLLYPGSISCRSSKPGLTKKSFYRRALTSYCFPKGQTLTPLHEGS
jgi:hypothetical protein